MKAYLPEGLMVPEKIDLNQALETGEILCSKAVLCDKEHNLYVDYFGERCIIEKNEGAIGIETGEVRDIAIISKVNKNVCFKVIGFKNDGDKQIPVLSRRRAQIECMKNYIDKLNTGDIIDAVVTHMEGFGVFADIGAGINALMPIDTISISRIPHPNARFNIGDKIKAVVKSRDDAGRITLSHKELLGTWEENAENFKAGETVLGIVRGIENYGIFVELSPNLAGLAEYVPDINPMDCVSVFIKSINPSKMKIKLIIIESFSCDSICPEMNYFIDSGRIDKWIYSPKECDREIISLLS